jgi:putative aldouronate transport system substrate-binding protein
MVFVLIICAVFASCQKKEAVAASGGGGADTSKEVHLVGYLLGDEQVGMENVMKELNVKLKKDINATMEIRYIGWGDLASKYPLVLASGDLDFIYTAPWAFYSQEAMKNAFYELTQDSIKTYMPRHYAALDPAAYKQAEVTVNGKRSIFMIPTSTPDKKSSAILIRKDLREKYGLPPIKKFTDIEPYLAAVNNEPGMTPMMLDNTYDVKRPFGDLLMETGYSGEDIFSATAGGLNILYEWQKPDVRVFTYFDEPNRSAVIEVSKKVKTWYDKGYINSDLFGNTVRSKEAFAQGKSGVAFGNSIDLQSNMATAVDNGWDVEIIPIVGPDGKYPRDAYTNNGIALAAKTKNPERTLMALDLIMQEPSYVMLTYFGIEGKNYVIKSDGKVGNPPGVTADSNTYPIDASGFWFVSKDLMPPLESWTDSYVEHRKNLTDSILANNFFNGFVTNKDATKTEEANCLNVFMQYGQPLFAGAVKDVDASFAELEKNAKAAGYDKIVEEAKKQMAAYVSANSN